MPPVDENQMTRRLIDLAGRSFGRLLVIERGPDYKPRIPQWLCKCECGNQKLVNGWSLRAGLTTSCGCRRREITIARFTTHGKAHRVPEYAIWNMMIQRCTNPKNKSYGRYGARGIKVCKRWLKFKNFFADMGPKPSKEHTVERIDNDGDYTPVNCAWAKMRRQSNNRRNNRKIKFRGRKMTLRQIMEETNCQINFNTMRARVFGAGRSIEDALSRPLHGR